VTLPYVDDVSRLFEKKIAPSSLSVERTISFCDSKLLKRQNPDDLNPGYQTSTNCSINFETSVAVIKDVLEFQFPNIY
jgi:hypothetical protein